MAGGWKSMWFSETVTSGLKISGALINFMPSWWYGQCGIAYGRKMVFDPDYRVNAHREMRRLFHERFGRHIGAGERDPRPAAVPPDWQNTYYQAMMGFEILYPDDQYPMAHGRLSPEQVARLKAPSAIWEEFPYCEILRQTRYLNARLGVDESVQLPVRGILNEAIQMCSTDFYGMLLDEEDETADGVMGFVGDVIRSQLLYNRERRASARFVALNCTAAIAGKNAYAARVLPHDLALYEWCRRAGIPYGIHHCGKFDDFLPIYAAMPGVFFLEIGHESRIRPVLERYPESQVQYIMNTGLVSFGAVGQIRDRIDEILEETRGYWDRLTIAVPDLENGMPDENLLGLVEALKR